MGKRQRRIWYTFYEAATDDFICCGTADECAKRLGMSLHAVQTAHISIRRGKCTSLAVVKEDLQTGEVTTYCPALPKGKKKLRR